MAEDIKFNSVEIYSRQQEANRIRKYSRRKAIKDLPETPNPDLIDELTSGATLRRCDECSFTKSPVLVKIGEDIDYHSYSTWLCSGCVAKLLGLLIDKTWEDLKDRK